MPALNSTALPPLLVIDDEPRVLAALREVLERQGHAVVAVGDPREALRLLGEREFSVVISDHLMPGMSGLDFLVECQRVRPDATRILVTAVLSLPTLVDAINRGEIYRFIAKPWLREELAATVRNAVNRYELVTQNRRLHQEAEMLNRQLSLANIALEGQVTTLEKQGRALDAANGELSQRYDLSLDLCSRILATYDPYLAGQTKAVVDIAKQMATSADFSAEDRQLLVTSAWLCDLGLIGVSREVHRAFRRDPARLDTRDLAAIKNHPIYSQTLAAHVDGRTAVGEVVRAHHERYDGTGYPDGIAGETIPWAARCLAVAVWFVECGSSGGKALEEVNAQAGKALDAEAVRLFNATARQRNLPRTVREVMLNDLQPGMVLAGGIYSPHGLLLVGEGQPLASGMIAKIRSHNMMTPINQRLLVYS